MFQSSWNHPHLKPRYKLCQLSIFFFFFSISRTIRKFLGQGLNRSHSSNQSHSSNTTRSLNTRPPGNSCFFFFFLSFTQRKWAPQHNHSHPALHYQPREKSPFSHAGLEEVTLKASQCHIFEVLSWFSNYPFSLKIYKIHSWKYFFLNAQRK